MARALEARSRRNFDDREEADVGLPPLLQSRHETERGSLCRPLERSSSRQCKVSLLLRVRPPNSCDGHGRRAASQATRRPRGSLPPAPGACQGCCAAASPACAPGVMQSTFFPRLIDHDFLERGRPPTFKPGGRSRLTRSTRTSRCRGARPRFDAGLRSRSACRWRPCQARPEPPAPSPFRVGPRVRSRPQPWPVFPTSGGRLRCALPIWPRPSGAQQSITFGAVSNNPSGNGRRSFRGSCRCLGALSAPAPWPSPPRFRMRYL